MLLSLYIPKQYHFLINKKKHFYFIIILVFIFYLFICLFLKITCQTPVFLENIKKIIFYSFNFKTFFKKQQMDLKLPRKYRV